MNKFIVIIAAGLIGLGGCSPSNSVAPPPAQSASLTQWEVDHPSESPSQALAELTAWQAAHPGQTYPVKTP